MYVPPSYRLHGLLEDLVYLPRLSLELRLEHRDVAVLLLLQRHQVRLVTGTTAEKSSRAERCIELEA